MFDLARFSLTDMVECGSVLRRIGIKADSMEAAAARIVGYLYEHLIDKQSGQRSCVLIRLYKTHPYGELDTELREFAGTMLTTVSAAPTTKCLTLLATIGEKQEWNSRRLSVAHRAIPLPSEEVVKQIPMISQLVKQFGLEINSLLSPDPALLLDLEQKTYNVFHVPEAVGSPYIPAQREFVIPYGIRSVLGFGGMLPSGDLFAIIMFSRAHIPHETADSFRTVALSAKMALLPFVGEKIFA